MDRQGQAIRAMALYLQSTTSKILIVMPSAVSSCAAPFNRMSSFLYADMFRLLNCTQQFSILNPEALRRGFQPDWFVCELTGGPKRQ